MRTSREVQLARYKTLLSFLDEHFKNDINIAQIEAACHYSYRNINRIFAALHQETIGKYIKRLRLEKAAQYLKYSALPIAEIAYEVGFKERAAFNKAFKKKFRCSPTAFREGRAARPSPTHTALLPADSHSRDAIPFEISYLPPSQYLFIEYRGDYRDFAAMEEAAEQLYQYAMGESLLSEGSVFMTEILDDSEISDSIHLRYHLGFVLEPEIGFEPAGIFRIKQHPAGKYAKFTHRGSYDSCLHFHEEIYANWLLDVNLELKDLPTLEIYPEASTSLSTSTEILTEIYIPVY